VLLLWPMGRRAGLSCHDPGRGVRIRPHAQGEENMELTLTLSADQVKEAVERYLADKVISRAYQTDVKELRRGKKGYVVRVLLTSLITADQKPLEEE